MFEKFEAAVQHEIAFADQRGALTGAQRREQVARRIIPELGNLLPEPWATIVRVGGASVLEVIIHLIRSKGSALKALQDEVVAAAKAVEAKDTEIAQLQAELKTAQDAVEAAHAEVAELGKQLEAPLPVAPKPIKRPKAAS
jgi:peptidoglycan hydrolase CwlO-like protein